MERICFHTTDVLQEPIEELLKRSEVKGCFALICGAAIVADLMGMNPAQLHPIIQPTLSNYGIAILKFQVQASVIRVLISFLVS